MQQLLAAHAAVNAAAADSCTALHYAANFGQTTLTHTYIRDSGEESTHTRSQPAPSAVACVKLLLDAQASVDAADSVGATALYVAARWGDVAVVRMLLGAKAAVHAADRGQDTFA